MLLIPVAYLPLSDYAEAMTIFEIIGLGLIQGLTEFLPVSSSGHLLAARLLFGISDADGTTVDAFLHLGTLGAVLVYYWRTWWRLLAVERGMLVKLAAATVPAGAAGWFLGDEVDRWLRNPYSLAAALLFTAYVLWWFDRYEESENENLEASWQDALTVGLAQVAALIPGVSRSGMTIAAGRARGMTRRAAVTFSFLLSAPIIAGASLSALLKLAGDGQAGVSMLTTGLIFSFLSGYTAIYWLMKYIERISFRPFVYYLIALSLFVLLWV